MKRLTRAVALAALAIPGAVVAQAAPARPVEVTLAEWKIQMPSDTIAAGAVTFRITNAGGINHAFYVLGGGVSEGSKEIPAKQSVTLKLTLKPGEYEVYCPLADQSHKMAGMSRKVVVVNREATKQP
jgi:plastocyanin